MCVCVFACSVCRFRVVCVCVCLYVPNKEFLKNAVLYNSGFVCRGTGGVVISSSGSSKHAVFHNSGFGLCAQVLPKNAVLYNSGS